MQQLRADPLELTYEHVTSGGPDRDLAQYRLALELCDSLASYHPARFPERPFELEGKTFAEVEASVSNGAFALVFGGWRAAVTELEAVSAQRLLVLCSTLGALFSLGPRTEDVTTLENIESMVTRLHTHLAWVWRLDPPGTDTDLRSWSVATARRYDLLPRSWRHV